MRPGRADHAGRTGQAAPDGAGFVKPDPNRKMKFGCNKTTTGPLMSNLKLADMLQNRHPMSLTVLETQNLIDGEAAITLIPKNSGVLGELVAAGQGTKGRGGGIALSIRGEGRLGSEDVKWCMDYQTQS